MKMESFTLCVICSVIFCSFSFYFEAIFNWRQSFWINWVEKKNLEILVQVPQKPQPFDSDFCFQTWHLTVVPNPNTPWASKSEKLLFKRQEEFSYKRLVTVWSLGSTNFSSRARGFRKKNSRWKLNVKSLNIETSFYFTN